VIPGHHSIVIETDPLGLLIQSTADGDVEVTDLPIVEDVACGWLIEGVLIVQDPLLKGADMVLILFCGDSGVGLSVSDGLEESIGDTPE